MNEIERLGLELAEQILSIVHLEPDEMQNVLRRIDSSIVDYEEMAGGRYNYLCYRLDFVKEYNFKRNISLLEGT